MPAAGILDWKRSKIEAYIFQTPNHQTNYEELICNISDLLATELPEGGHR
jgi:hypothetical protein